MGATRPTRLGAVISDGLSGLSVPVGMVEDHQPIVTGPGRAAARHPPFRWVYTLPGRLKTAITGTYHAINSPKYVQRDHAKAQYRFSRLTRPRHHPAQAPAHRRHHTRSTATYHQAGGSLYVIRKTKRSKPVLRGFRHRSSPASPCHAGL